MNPELPPNPRAELESRLTALLLGELSAEDAAALRQTLAADPALAALHQRLSLTLELVRETAATSAGTLSEQPAPLRLSSARREALLAHFKTIRPPELAQPKAKSRRISWLVPLAAAAALVLLCGQLLFPRLASRARMARTEIMKEDRNGGLAGNFDSARAIEVPNLNRNLNPNPQQSENVLSIRAAPARASSIPAPASAIRKLSEGNQGDSISEAAKAKATGSRRLNNPTKTAGDPNNPVLVSQLHEQILKSFDSAKPSSESQNNLASGASSFLSSAQVQKAEIYTPLVSDDTLVGQTASTDSKNPPDHPALNKPEVFLLTYADSKAVAQEMKDVFAKPDNQTASQGENPFGIFGGGRGGRGGGGSDGDNRQPTGGLVNAVSDDQNNAVIINAAPDMIPGISNLIAKLDIPQDNNLQLKVLPLQHANARDVASELGSMFPNPNGPASQGNAGGRGAMARFGGEAGVTGATANTLSDRMKRELTVNAVPDERTQSVLVTASKDTMPEVEKMVANIDGPLQDIFSSSTSRSDASQTSALTQRQNTAAQNGGTLSASSLNAGGLGGGNGAGVGHSTSAGYAPNAQIGPITMTVDPVSGSIFYTTDAAGYLTATTSRGFYDDNYQTTPNAGKPSDGRARLPSSRDSINVTRTNGSIGGVAINSPENPAPIGRLRGDISSFSADFTTTTPNSINADEADKRHSSGFETTPGSALDAHGTRVVGGVSSGSSGGGGGFGGGGGGGTVLPPVLADASAQQDTKGIGFNWLLGNTVLNNGSVGLQAGPPPAGTQPANSLDDISMSLVSSAGTIVLPPGAAASATDKNVNADIDLYVSQDEGTNQILVGSPRRGDLGRLGEPSPPSMQAALLKPDLRPQANQAVSTGTNSVHLAGNIADANDLNWNRSADRVPSLATITGALDLQAKPRSYNSAKQPNKDLEEANGRVFPLTGSNVQVDFATRNISSPALQTKTFHVDQTKLAESLKEINSQVLTGTGGEIGRGSGGFAGGGSVSYPMVNAAPRTAKTSGPNGTAVVQKYLSSFGVNVTNNGAFVFDNDRAGELLVRADAKDMETISQAIELLGATPPSTQAQKNASASTAPTTFTSNPSALSLQPLALPKPPSPKPATNSPTPQTEIQTATNAFSTFSLNVSDVSFKLAAASLQKGALPDPAAIRSEEFINAFDYRDLEPAPGAPIGFAWDRANYPFAHNRDLLRFSVKTAAQGRDTGRPLNLVLLLDKSGSMERADRVAIIHEALRVLAGQLQPRDTISVVLFARTARLWADGVSGAKVAALADELDGVTPEGGTNLEDAMKLAYETALRHYLANGENRVVILTDGAANLGDVKPEDLQKKAAAERTQGIALDCFGVGWEDYNDNLLEVLSRSGGGRYGFINAPEEAATEFAGQLAGALRVAASDVKVQVEFNPSRVTSYRQIGYAKDQLTKEQFRDNTVKAAQLGVKESGNALYTVEINPQGSGPLCTVHVRYRTPGTSDYYEHAWDVPYTGPSPSLDQAGPSIRLAATASAFSEWLAGSPYAGEVTPDQLLGYMRNIPELYGADHRPAELAQMLREAKSISGQ